MVTRFSLMVLIAVMGLGVRSSSQVRPLPPHPDLSGSWVVSSTEGVGYSPFGARFTVEQDASAIIITSERSSITYTLDDAEHSRATPTAAGGSWTEFSRARFVTAALVVTTRIDAGTTGHWEDLFIVSLDKPGQVTVVACNATKSLSGGMSTHVFKYTKATPPRP